MASSFDESVELIDDSILKEIFEVSENVNISEQNKCQSFLSDILDLETEAVLNKKQQSKRKFKRSEELQNLDEDKTQNLRNSSIHKGDTDSSDDEDNKYFHEQKYNECGKNIKHLLKETTKSKSDFYTNSNDDNVSKRWTQTKQPTQKSSSNIKLPEGLVKSDVLADPVFHMRIVNPQISSNLITERMIGRTPVLMFKIKNFIQTEDIKSKDWVTGGVIIAKSMKTSSKGNQYCIWNITDLHHDIKTITVFLFGTAYKELWKTPVGTVVGILNPNVLEEKKNSKGEATLSVDNCQKIMVFGTSKDFGTCKSKKKNGDVCMNVVNLAKCEYCVYHLKQEYKKMSTRLELQSSCAGRGLNNLRNKVLGKNEVFYAGKSFTSVSAKKSTKLTEKNNKLLGKLNMAINRNTEKDKTLLDKLNSNQASDRQEQNIQSSTQTPIQRNTSLSKSPFLSSSTSQCSTKTPIQRNTNLPNSPFLSPTTSQSIKLTPSPKTGVTSMLQPKLTSPTSVIDLDAPISKKRLNLAKLNAINFVKQNGILKSESEKQKSDKRKEAIKRKVEEDTTNGTKRARQEEKESPKDGKTLLKEKLERIGITDKYVELMKTECKNTDLARLAEQEEQDKYYKRLEIKEQIEEKMLSTYKIECKAVRCLKCNYKSFSASDLCKSEKHPLKVVNAVKRFWKCGDCGNRTVCLELVPLHSCSNCGSSKWEKTSMMKEKKDMNLVRPTLSIRGHEEASIGSVTNANISLLVPE